MCSFFHVLYFALLPQRRNKVLWKLGLRILTFKYAVDYWRILMIKIIFKDLLHMFCYLLTSQLAS